MSELNLHQKLVEVRKSIDSFVKDSQSYGYSYVSGTQVLAKIKDKMDELGVLLFPAIVDQTHEIFPYKDKYGKDKQDFLVFGEMRYKWVNADKPSDEIEIPFQYMGQQDDISKAFGSGLTYSERYFLLKFFGVPTDNDDPDHKDNSKKKEEKPKQEQKQQQNNKPPVSGDPNLLSDAQKKKLNAQITQMEKKFNLTREQVIETLGKKEGVTPFEHVSNLTKAQASKCIEILTKSLEG
jgi:hypothetical protein